MGGGLEADLSHGAVAAIWRKAEKGSAKALAAVLQVTDVRADRGPAERYRVVLTDGVHAQPAVLCSAMNHLVAGRRAIRAGTVVRVLDYVCDAVRDSRTRRTIEVIQLEILQLKCPLIGSFKLYEPRRGSGGFVTRSTAYLSTPNHERYPGRLGTQWSAAWFAPGRERRTANNLPHGGSHGGSMLTPIARWAAEPDVCKMVSQIKDENLGYSEMPDLIVVKASVSYINTESFCYAACPLLDAVEGRRCNKEVTREVDGMLWYCSRCDKMFENCDYRYSARIQIQDPSGMTYAHAYEEAGNDIFCHTAKELYLMKCQENDYAQFADVVHGVLLNEYVFDLKVKLGAYYDGPYPCASRQEENRPPRVACTIVRAQKLNAS